MFICQTCIKKFEGPSVDYAVKVAGGHGWGMSLEFVNFAIR